MTEYQNAVLGWYHPQDEKPVRVLAGAVRMSEGILDLCATVPIRFVIADGIVAMEGNGPADATCARLIGFHPGRVTHNREGL